MTRANRHGSTTGVEAGELDAAPAVAAAGDRIGDASALGVEDASALGAARALDDELGYARPRRTKRATARRSIFDPLRASRGIPSMTLISRTGQPRCPTSSRRR